MVAGTAAFVLAAVAATATPAVASIPSYGLGVLRIRAGRYQVVVRDTTRRAGLRFTGPRLARATGTAFTGRAVWQLTLRPGTYRVRSTVSPRALVFRVSR